MGKREKEIWNRIVKSVKSKGKQEVARGLTNELVKKGYDKEDAKLAAQALVTKNVDGYSYDSDGVLTVQVDGRRLQPSNYGGYSGGGSVSPLLLIGLAGLAVFFIARKG